MTQKSNPKGKKKPKRIKEVKAQRFEKRQSVVTQKVLGRVSDREKRGEGEYQATDPRRFNG